LLKQLRGESSKSLTVKKMKNSVFVRSATALTAGALFIVTGCNKSPQATAQKDDHGHDHPSGPPHGGTPVKVGEHDFHLELVNDPQAGKMLAFVMDDHMEHAESVPPTTFDLVAKMGGQEHRATFKAGEESTPPTTNISVFSASADWFKTATNFDGVIPTITLKGETFTNVTFTFPKGTRHSH
jgi:hypothetical protein